jgi:nucleoside 2-deoxyribosyltransferase
MKYKEVVYENIRNNYSNEIVERYTSTNGYKFYLIIEKDYFEKDYQSTKYAEFKAFPKYYPSEIRDVPLQSFVFGFGEMYKMIQGINNTYESFLKHYGLNEFKKWLNEIEPFKSQERDLILRSTDNIVEPNSLNGELIVPNEREDNIRLQNLAQRIILEEYFNNMGEEKIPELRLREKCFVPNKIFDYVYNILIADGMLNIKDGGLTSHGNTYYKNENIENVAINNFSKTVFIAQAFRSELEVLYKNVLKSLIEVKFKLNPIKINDTDPDDPVDVEILKQINQSRFVICDLTFARPSVYFEAGYAIAKGIKVIFTARDDHNSDSPKYNERKIKDDKIHFDLRNRQITFWDENNYSLFEQELEQRISNYLELQKKNNE